MPISSVTAKFRETVSFRAVTTPDDLRLVGQLRYAVYVEEMRRTEKRIVASEKRVIEEITPGTFIYGAFEGQECIATVRYTIASELSEWERHFYETKRLGDDLQTGICLTTKMIVAGSARSSLTGIRLLTYSINDSLSRGGRLALIDCNQPRVPFFRQLGFRPFAQNKLHPLYGEVSIMLLPFADEEWLAACRSPLRKRLSNQHVPQRQIAAIRLVCDYDGF